MSPGNGGRRDARRKPDDDERADDETIAEPFDDDLETIAGALPVEPGASERRRGESGPVRSGRDEETIVGPIDEDLETVVGAPATEVGSVSSARDDETLAGPNSVGDAARPSGVDRTDSPDATIADAGHGLPQATLAEDEQTIAGTAPIAAAGGSRGDETVAGGFAATRHTARAASDPDDEDATVYDAALPSKLARQTGATQHDAAAGTPRRGDVTEAVSRGGSATAADAAAAGYTERGGHSSAAIGPLRLEKNEPLGGRYTLDKRLGKGGMGEVWKAKHDLLEGYRAIKVIKAQISRDPQFRARFLTEGQTMMRVKHPGVVEVTDLAETRNRELFMVMEHLEGRTLQDAIRDEDTPLRDDLRNVARIYRELALGMQRIHDERIVHKDLKSDNALLVKGDDGLEHPKVIDFGLAKSLDGDDTAPSDSGPDAEGGYDPDLRTTLSGTLAYMSPEQFLGRPSSFQSDIYAFGVMLYECMMKGEFPMKRGGLAHYITMHSDGVKPALLKQQRPDLDPFIAELSDRCMAPRKEDRPESFAEVAEQLQWWLDAPERARRRRKLIGMVAAAVFLVGVAIAGFFLGEQTASLSNPQISVAGRIVSPAPDNAVHLRDDMLGEIELAADVTGESNQPFVEIGGERIEADTREDAGQLIATMNLSGLEDGQHKALFFASAGAAPTSLDLVVDRKAPGIRSIEVPGARDSFSNAVTPDVRVSLDEASIETVVARVDQVPETKPGSVATADGPRDLWIIPATAQGDGEIAMDIEVRDYAGNVANQRFRYVRDRKLSDPVIRDLSIEDGRLPVRGGVGAKLSVTIAEPARLVLTVGGAEVEQVADAAGEVTFDLPAVTGALDANIQVVDRAGNTFSRDLRVEVQQDIAEIVTLEDKVATRTVGAVREVPLLFRRSYALESPQGVLATKIRDAEGKPVDAAGAEIAARFGSAVPPFGVEVTIPSTELGEGSWLLTPLGQGVASTSPFELTIDTTSPRLASVVVRDADGHEVDVDSGAWSHSRRVTVEVDVADTSLRQISIEGAGPANGPFSPGTTTRRFDLTFPADGPNESSITLTDDAGNPATTIPLTIRTDATDPGLTLTAPRNGATGNDRDGLVVRGSVANESRFKVHVLIPGTADVPEDEIEQAFETPDFEIPSVRPPVGTHTLEIWVTDDAGRTSVRQRVSVTIERLAVELPVTFEWSGEVNSTMRKLEPGDVLIGVRNFSVRRTYVDRTEVTNAQYRTFIEATGGVRDERWSHPDTPDDWSHIPPADTWGDPAWSADDRPVVNVAWWDAYAFAKWSGRRLPTEAEWVKAAAKEEGEPDLLRWPFGNAWEDGLLVTRELLTAESDESSPGPRSALEGNDVSPLGCLHLGGNVSEWVDLEREPEGNPLTAVRGGNWYLSAAAANVRDVPAKRYDPSQRHATIGFRCAVPAAEVERRMGSMSR